jgi:hypothetical protein
VLPQNHWQEINLYYLFIGYLTNLVPLIDYKKERS